MKCNKSSTQQSIQYTDCKNSNDLSEIVKTKFVLADTSFVPCQNISYRNSNLTLKF